MSYEHPGVKKDAPPYNDKVTISAQEYQSLKRKADKLAALESYGVDNWEGYGDAMASLPSDDVAEAGK